MGKRKQSNNSYSQFDRHTPWICKAGGRHTYTFDSNKCHTLHHFVHSDICKVWIDLPLFTNISWHKWTWYISWYVSYLVIFDTYYASHGMSSYLEDQFSAIQNGIKHNVYDHSPFVGKGIRSSDFEMMLTVCNVGSKTMWVTPDIPYNRVCHITR